MSGAIQFGINYYILKEFIELLVTIVTCKVNSLESIPSLGQLSSAEEGAGIRDNMW